MRFDKNIFCVSYRNKNDTETKILYKNYKK